MFWLFSLYKKRAGIKSRGLHRPAFRPRLELLETREVPSIYTVTNTSGNVNTAGSLPWAVFQTNYVTHGLNYILFNIPGTGEHVITVNQTLWVNDQTVIDGTSQPGYSGPPLISVQGNGSVYNLFQVQDDPTQQVTAKGSTIQGLDLYDYTGNGIALLNTSGGACWIQHNWIGFYQDLAGTTHLNSTLFNFTSSIDILSTSNTIRNNTLSGGYNAVVLGENPSVTWSGTIYSGNSIQDNMIGTDPTGMTTAGYGNTSDAIAVGAGAQKNLLGPSNVLSGNQNNAVEFDHSSDLVNVLFANYIGTSANGNVALGNGHFGVLVAGGAQDTWIGSGSGGNIISGNAGGGISLGTGGGLGNAVQTFVGYNIVGLNGSQTAIIGTQSIGICVQSGSTGNLLENNVVAGATLNGVVVSSATGNGIMANWIGESASGLAFANDAFGIALLPGASFNFIQSNAFGANKFGPYYLDPQAVGNDIT
jgi:hypothetical protein